MPRAAVILANTLFLFAWAAWLGGIVTVGAVSAPGIFRAAREWPEAGSAELVRRFAGAAAGEGFRRFNGLALAAGLLLLVAAMAAWALEGGRSGRRARLHALRLVLGTAAFGIALWLTLHLFPTLVALRRAGAAGEFDALHHAYERWTMAEFWLLAAAGLLTAALGADARPASRPRSAFEPGPADEGVPAPVLLTLSGPPAAAGKLITPEQLAEARAAQKGSGQDLGEILLEKGLIDATQLLQARARVHGLKAVDVGAVTIDSSAVNVVPWHVAKRHCVIPLVKQGDGLVVAVTDPTNVLALDDLKSSSGLKIRMVLGAKEPIEAAIERHYGTA